MEETMRAVTILEKFIVEKQESMTDDEYYALAAAILALREKINDFYEPRTKTEPCLEAGSSSRHIWEYCPYCGEKLE